MEWFFFLLLMLEFLVFVSHPCWCRRVYCYNGVYIVEIILDEDKDLITPSYCSCYMDLM